MGVTGNDKDSPLYHYRSASPFSIDQELVAKKAETLEMTELYKNGMTLQEIGDQYGISRQTISRRFKDMGFAHLERLPKYARIDKDRLEDLYAGERLSISKISEAFRVTSNLIYQALNFHKIPKRSSIKLNGKYVDLLRQLEVSEKIEVDSDAKKPYVVLHRSAKRAGVKISVRKLERGKFLITRISKKEE